jgi:hypothetical protein
VPHLHELFGQIRHDTFSAAVKAGRHTLHERRDLSDSHFGLIHVVTNLGENEAMRKKFPKEGNKE